MGRGRYRLDGLAREQHREERSSRQLELPLPVGSGASVSGLVLLLALPTPAACLYFPICAAAPQKAASSAQLGARQSPFARQPQGLSPGAQQPPSTPAPFLCPARVGQPRCSPPPTAGTATAGAVWPREPLLSLLCPQKAAVRFPHRPPLCPAPLPVAHAVPGGPYLLRSAPLRRPVRLLPVLLGHSSLRPCSSTPGHTRTGTSAPAPACTHTYKCILAATHAPGTRVSPGKRTRSVCSSLVHSPQHAMKQAQAPLLALSVT